MTDCQRPTGEACNCCNDGAIQHRLTEITQWLERLEWLIAEIQNRPVGNDWQLTGCGAFCRPHPCHIEVFNPQPPASPCAMSQQPPRQRGAQISQVQIGGGRGGIAVND